MLTLAVVLVIYVMSIQWCKVTMKKVIVKNGWGFEFSDIVISFVPFVNIGFATYFTVELLISKLDKKHFYNVNINKQKLIKKFFKL